MPTVKFSDPEDFLEELAKDKEKVDRGIVRLVYSFNPSTHGITTHLSVVATALVGTQLYRLETYCGDLWRIESPDQPVHEKGSAVKEAIAAGCAKLGLEVRGGAITE